MVWTDAIDKFYKLFHPIVEEAASVRTEHKVGERELGIDPEERQTCFREDRSLWPSRTDRAGAPQRDKEAPKPSVRNLDEGAIYRDDYFGRSLEIV